MLGAGTPYNYSHRKFRGEKLGSSALSHFNSSGRMPQLQLAVGAFLVCCALLSGTAIVFQDRKPDREIQLSENNDEISGLNDGMEVEDPFEVATAEDVLDGYPIAEEKFWVQVRCFP